MREDEKRRMVFQCCRYCGVFSKSKNARVYWGKLKQRLNEERSEPVTFCHGLKLKAADGNMRETDVVNIQGIFHIIQEV